jgi:tRNA pseudouridine55 synthase
MAYFGILNVNKPAGVTSRDVVDRVERLVRPDKAGHAGTLDPLATGVLVICVGQATRLIQYIQRMPKTYRATFLLGRRSDTDDVEGQVLLVENVLQPTRQELDRVLPQFLGEIRQRPPAHSAVKVAGQRAYALARKGVDFELAERFVTISKINVCRYEYPELELDIECGSGTYIRSLGRDIGGALGTGAVMSALRRTSVGWFRYEDSHCIDDFGSDTLRKYLRPPTHAVIDLPQMPLSEAELAEIRHGRAVKRPSSNESGTAADPRECVATDYHGRFVAILYEKRPGEYWPRINFI